MAGLFADISHYQNPVDLAAYKAAGYDRLMLKATGGATDGTLRFKDDTYAPRALLAKQLGIKRIPYHFARNNNPGAAEADWFIENITAAAAGPFDHNVDEPNYDQEDNRPGMTALARQRTIEFTNRMVERGYDEGTIYSGVWYLNPAGILPTDVPEGWRQLHLSDYTPGQPDGSIELPNGWPRSLVVARQYTDAQTGIPGLPSTDADRVLHEWIEVDDDMAGPFTDDQLHQITEAMLDALDVGAQYTHGHRLDNMAARFADVQWARHPAATVAQVQQAVAVLTAPGSPLLAAVGSVQDAVLGALAALPTSHLTDEEKAALATAVASQVTGLEAEAAATALRTVLLRGVATDATGDASS